MAGVPANICVIRTAEQLDAICSPVRAAILETLLAFGPMAAREVAAKIGKAVNLTHHHVGLLARAGLVAEQGKVKRGRHMERVFHLPFDDFRFDFDTNPKVAAKGMARVAKTFGRFSERMLVRSLQGGLTELMKEFATFRCETAHLPRESAQQIRSHLLAIRGIFGGWKSCIRRQIDQDSFQIYWAFYPLNKGKKRAATGRLGKGK